MANPRSTIVNDWVKANQDRHFCQCGCGRALIIKREHKSHGVPRYILGHSPGCTRSAEERFWEQVEKSDGCWLWMGALVGNGYGRMNVGPGIRIQAHRFSWQLHNGPIPEGLWVLHNCPGGDNPRCVRPEHLWLGTAANNSQDSAAKGRHLPMVGMLNPNVRLSADQVRAIRQAKGQGETGQQLAERYEVALSTIYKIWAGRLWPTLS